MKGSAKDVSSTHKPATGRLGIITPGLGAVATTFMAGVEAVKRGLGLPVGSLTQMGTIRLGKRTDNRTPRIKEFVPLATLLCFCSVRIGHVASILRPLPSSPSSIVSQPVEAIASCRPATLSVCLKA